MIEKRMIHEKINELTQELSKKDRNIFDKFPLETCINNIKSYSQLYNYNFVSQKLNDIFDDILNYYGFSTLSLYNKLLLSEFIHQKLINLDKHEMPGDFCELYHEWFKDILDDFVKQPDDYFTLKNEPFLKDLAVCSSRAIPVGGGCMVTVSGVERKFIINAGLVQMFERLGFALFRMGGFKPFYHTHVVSRYVDRFNSKERTMVYCRIATLLEYNKDIKGFMGSSWFYDPIIKSISPHLSYLSDTPLKNGAKVFHIASTQEDIKNATYKSMKRRKLYEEGRYTPTSYYIVWPRKAMIQWATDACK